MSLILGCYLDTLYHTCRKWFLKRGLKICSLNGHYISDWSRDIYIFSNDRLIDICIWFPFLKKSKNFHSAGLKKFSRIVLWYQMIGTMLQNYLRYVLRIGLNEP